MLATSLPVLFWQLSESQQRMLELHKERELENERERMESIAAGVVTINSRQEFDSTCAQDETDTLIVIFWGGPWCRKCNALKPEVRVCMFAFVFAGLDFRHECQHRRRCVDARTNCHNVRLHHARQRRMYRAFLT